MTPAVAVAPTDRDLTLAARTYGAASPGSLWAIGSIGKSPPDAHLRPDRQLRPRAGVDVRRHRAGRNRARLRARRALPLLRRRLPRRRRRAAGRDRAAV